MEKNSIIQLKESGIVLHIADAIGHHYKEDSWIAMKDPSQLFHGKGFKFSTQAIYYTENILHEIDQHEIGGIEGRPIRKKKAVRDICSIKLKFRNDSPVYRVFINPQKTVRLANIVIQDENKRNWVARWRIAGKHEPEWWRPFQRLSN